MDKEIPRHGPVGGEAAPFELAVASLPCIAQKSRVARELALPPHRDPAEGLAAFRRDKRLDAAALLDELQPESGSAPSPAAAP